MYTYDQVYQASLKYFEGNDLAAKVFVDKYALRDNNDNYHELTPDDMHRRIAREFARIEKNKFKEPMNEDEIYELLENYSCIIPQGSPLFGVGNPYSIVSTSNCFVAEPPMDSYNDILHTDNQLVNISKRRGGVGIDLDNLRPTGTPTKNSAKTSSGITSWMERYSNSTREVGQLNRRGALMLTLSVHHPDIEQFLTIKSDRTKVTGANISVKYTDEFLNALINEQTYEQRFPINSKKPQIKKLVSAKKIWDLAVQNSFESAEPGVLFWDNILRESPADCYEEYETISTNPCQPSWAKVLTPDGIKTFADISVGDKIWSSEGWTKVINKWSTGIKEVYKYETTSSTFYGTDSHKIVCNGEKIEVKFADCIDNITGLFSTDIVLDTQDIMDGLVIGDGSVHKASNNLVGLYIGKNDQDYFNSEIKDLIIENKTSIKDIFYTIKTTIDSNELPHLPVRSIPDRFYYGKPYKVAGFLRGLYSANGSVIDGRVTLKTTSVLLREQVQTMLSSIGISSYYTTNKPTKVKFSNGEYLCKESYDINITKDRCRFYQLIGFIQQYKQDKLEFYVNKHNTTYKYKTTFDIKNIEYLGEEEVFDITVDNKSHTYWAQGCNVSNCSELPLSKLDSCRLLAINLMYFVKNPFTDKAYFDYIDFYKKSQIAQRLMDDLVDLELEAIQRILNKIESDPEPDHIKQPEKDLWVKVYNACKNGRRTGTGITALGDVIAALDIRYGTEECINVVSKIYNTLKFGCYRSSIDMAKELGPFYVWDYEKEKDNPFLNRIKDEVINLSNDINNVDDLVNGYDIYDDMKKYGRRNISLLTTAPTGTISTQARYKINDKWYTGTSSGIEPVFMTSYTRRKKISYDDKTQADFVDQNGDRWSEFKVYHEGVNAFMDITGNDENASSYFNACAQDIDWINRVKLQAQAQKHVDHAISSTINLPNDVRLEVVNDIFLTAWKEGLKGITVYRDGCRTGVLVSNKEQKPQSRPDVLECEVHRIPGKDGVYFVLIGMLDGKPYEVFGGKGVDIQATHGQIIKVKRPKGYKAVLEDGMELSPLSAMCDDHEEALMRMASIALRSNTPIEQIVDQLTKTKGDMYIFAKAVARALKKYIKDGSKSTQKCTCGANLVYSEGCVTCLSCGASKCG